MNDMKMKLFRMSRIEMFEIVDLISIFAKYERLLLQKCIDFIFNFSYKL